MSSANSLFVFTLDIAECFARLSFLGVCLSVCPSVRHTLALYENGEGRLILILGLLCISFVIFTTG